MKYYRGRRTVWHIWVDDETIASLKPDVMLMYVLLTSSPFMLFHTDGLKAFKTHL